MYTPTAVTRLSGRCACSLAHADADATAASLSASGTAKDPEPRLSSSATVIVHRTAVPACLSERAASGCALAAAVSAPSVPPVLRRGERLVSKGTGLQGLRAVPGLEGLRDVLGLEGLKNLPGVEGLKTEPAGGLGAAPGLEQGLSAVLC